MLWQESFSSRLYIQIVLEMIIFMHVTRLRVSEWEGHV